MLCLKVPKQTAVVNVTSKRPGVSRIFAPKFCAPVVQIVRSLSFSQRAPKCELSQKKTFFAMATRSKSAVAAAAAANAPFLTPSVKRIMKESTCIILGITKESIRCTGCKNRYEKNLKSRVKSASIDSRHYKCDKPWVLKGKRTDKSIQIYNNTWKELVDELGYPNPKLHHDSSNIQKRKADHPKKTSVASRKMPPNSEVSKRKKQKLTTPPSDQDVEAYNFSCTTPMFLGHHRLRRRHLSPIL